MAYRPPPSIKRRRELSLPPPLSVQTQLGVQRILVIRPICSVSFSLACRPGEPCSVARGSASAAFTFSDGPAVPSSVESHPHAPPSSRRRWYASGCCGHRIQPPGTYLIARHPTSRRANTALVSDRPAFGRFVRIPLGPVYTVPIQRAIDSVYRATPLLGVLSPDIPLSANTPAAHSEMSTSSK